MESVKLSLRRARPGDEPAMAEIWKRVFGDGDDYIAGFFAGLYEPGRAVCAEAEGKLVSTAFFPRLGELVSASGERRPCSYVYAVATLPEYRSRGLGAAVSRAAAEGCLEDGGVSVICPAEPSLFDFYRKTVGFSNFFAVSETTVAPEAAAGPAAERIDAETYFALRESLLAGTDHIAFSDRAAAYQAYLCRSGGFFRTDGGLFALERTPDGALVKEALGSVPPSALAALDAEPCVIRAPAPRGAGRPFGMLLAPGPTPVGGSAEPWFGFAFD